MKKKIPNRSEPNVLFRAQVKTKRNETKRENRSQKLLRRVEVIRKLVLMESSVQTDIVNVLLVLILSHFRWFFPLQNCVTDAIVFSPPS